MTTIIPKKPVEDISEEMAEDVCDLSVAAYFFKYLGRPIDSAATPEALRNTNGLGMKIATPCGYGCKLAIDAARQFYPFCRNAGDGDKCITLARDACLVMIFS